MANQRPDAPALELDADKRSEFDYGDHSADQPTQTDQPVGGQPESSTANPNKTGVY